MPPEAPALLIAVPGPATPANEETAAALAATARESCPGVLVEAGYLQGGNAHLSTVLAGLGGHDGRAVVIVPLLTCPHAPADGAIAALATQAPFPVLVAGHLGPHPLLAEALHARLAEAGLARATRAGRLSIVSEADGIIVGAAGDAQAVQSAGVVAVLLASRLAIPVAPAPLLSGAAALWEASQRLRAAQVERVALAPCVVGPEMAHGDLETLASEAGMACAPPLGAHPAIGKLIAMRYGAALEDPRMVGSSLGA